ncbi:uncharacterized protein LOC115596980 isoform X2 [Sparus aurata]|uniref:uncharacterized protein LOC115596980 isoform X2 n=1 Tax=Sparus aurata TaxID=8175 RepID=UPI0011C105AF|nr:uncharacterized protein LOC115596980 isoform X2 [Sparus aurata]
MRRNNVPTVRLNQSLTRCAACYNQRAGSMPHRGGDSSSSAEDSGPEADWQSEAESSSSSSCSVEDLSEEPDEPETQTTSAAAAEAESGGGDADEGDETGGASESQKDQSRTKAVTRRGPLVKSSSSSFSSLTPHLAPLTLLPRPQTVVSTLRLQVLPQTNDDGDLLFVEQQEENSEESSGGRGRDGVNGLLHPPTGLPWQPFTLHHHHQQQPQHFPPLSAQGQRLLLPPPHTLPVQHLPMLHTHLQAPHTHLQAPHTHLQAPHTHLQAPHTHLQALADPHLCWYCYSMQFPYSPHWSLYGGGHLPR